MWNNEKGIKAALGHGVHPSVLQKHADMIWEDMTFHYELFTVKSVAENISKFTGLMPKTTSMYVGAFFAYCRAANEEFSGPASKLTKIGQGKYTLTDNPEL